MKEEHFIDYNVKIDESHYPYIEEVEWEDVKECPVCNGQHITYVWGYEIKKYPIRFWKCTTCGTIFLSPRMSDDYTKLFYKTYYPKYHHKYEETREHEIEKVRAFTLLGLLKLNTKKEFFCHLDVGSSKGILLNEFRTNLSIKESVGVEVDGVVRMKASDQFKDIFFVDTLEEVGEDTFDLITMSHVLEHFNHPTDELCKILEHLTDDGVLLLEVPNANANLGSYLLHHPIQFNSDSLGYLLTKIVGMKKALAFEHNVPSTRPLKIYLSVMAWNKKKPA
jgi:2-polyprenyl-3-methyl-5-hydroxy-6-metoxy-1,4-benzoquinol methylase